MLILASVGSSLVVVVTADPASGARATESVTEEAVPRFANLSEGQAWRVEQPPRQQLSSGHWVSSSRVAGVIDDVSGLRSTVGHAPFAVGDIIEPTTGSSDVEDSRGGPE